MYKQVFDLRTGECLDAVGKEPQTLRTWAVRGAATVSCTSRRPEPAGESRAMTTLLGVDLVGRPVLVAGGGPVAATKAAALVADGALRARRDADRLRGDARRSSTTAR